MDPALLLIVVGSVMFLITFFGCVGALRNATCLLKTVAQAADCWVGLLLEAGSQVCSSSFCSSWGS